MEYTLFERILNQQIFESSKKELLEKIAKSPDIYLGIFRPTKPKAKILQNLLQSNEIRFGIALEVLFTRYFVELGYTIESKTISYNDETLCIDQLFCDKDILYFVEQKIRDDHDSTKKRSQIDNCLSNQYL
jgi:hypothetical protein